MSFYDGHILEQTDTSGPAKGIYPGGGGGGGRINENDKKNYSTKNITTILNPDTNIILSRLLSLPLLPP